MNHRVLMITGEYTPQHGGIADYTQCLVNALAERGQAIRLVVPSGSDLSRTKAELAGTEPRWNWPILRKIELWLTRSRSNWLHIQYQESMYRSHPAILLVPR